MISSRLASTITALPMRAGRAIAERRRLARLGSRACTFMLHRFRQLDLGVEGHDTKGLRTLLGNLRRERIPLVSIDTLAAAVAQGRRTVSRPMVAFTIDDGYADQALVGAPIFAEFDCPVTTFVATGFLDRTLWFWWDRIEYIMLRSPRRSIHLDVGRRPLEVSMAEPTERVLALQALIRRFKEMHDAERSAAIDALAVAADVEVPAEAPPQYAPMSWDDLRRCEGMTMTFAPHTVTHPILSRVPVLQSDWEIRESWRRVSSEAKRPVKLFAYPNGRWGDFDDRELATLGSLGFRGAFVAEPGYPEAERIRRGGRERWEMPRFAYDEPSAALWVAQGKD